MPPHDNSRNTILFVVIAGIMLIAYSFFVMEPQAARRKAAQQAAAEQTAAGPTAATSSASPIAAVFDFARGSGQADIETRVGQVTVPLSYADELYSLRSHIAMVRQRLDGPASLQSLSNEILRQATMIGYLNAFYLMAFVALVATHRHGLLDLCAGFFKGLREQLGRQEFVRQALVDQDALRVGRARGPAHQRRGIVFGPDIPIVPQVAAEGLFAPGAAAGVRNGREGRHRLVLAGVAQGQGQGAVAAHRVAEDAGAVQVDRQVLAHQRVQLFGDVGLHLPGR